MHKRTQQRRPQASKRQRYFNQAAIVIVVDGQHHACQYPTEIGERTATAAERRDAGRRI